MTPTETVDILRQFNEWQKGDGPLDYSPNGLINAVDTAIEMIDRLEAAENEVTRIKEVEFPRKVRAVAAGWKTKCARLEQERTIDEQRIADLMEELNRVGHENDALRAAMEKIADWYGSWGPYPETNKSWCAMAIVTAREAVKPLTNLCAKGEEK